MGLCERRRRKIALRSHCRSEPPAVRSPSRRPGAALSGGVDLSSTDHEDTISKRQALIPCRQSLKQEADDVLRHELIPQGRSKVIDTERAQVFVEIAKPGRQM